MNAAASSLIEAIKYSFGSDPYTYPPGPNGTDWDYIPSGATSWYKYGSGGISSWGSLCGVPNGCIAVLNLMNLTSLADQVMYYACQTEFPLKGLHDIYLSDPNPSSWYKVPMPDDEVLAYTVANSPLCHVSVSRWAYAAKVSMTATTPYATAHKTDRCAKVAASVASFRIDQWSHKQLYNAGYNRCVRCLSYNKQPPCPTRQDGLWVLSYRFQTPYRCI
jgi:hypothetical protein